MEKILEQILKETNADRIILYKIEETKMFASQRSLWHLRPQNIIATEYSENKYSSQELYERSYPYHIFADAIKTLFDEGYFSFIPKIDNRISAACALGLESISKEAGSKSLNYFLIDDTHLISIHHCRVPTLIKRTHIDKYLDILKKVL